MIHNWGLQSPSLLHSLSLWNKISWNMIFNTLKKVDSISSQTLWNHVFGTLCWFLNLLQDLTVPGLQYIICMSGSGGGGAGPGARGQGGEGEQALLSTHSRNTILEFAQITGSPSISGMRRFPFSSSGGGICQITLERTEAVWHNWGS